jgi:hypothetical protein
MHTCLKRCTSPTQRHCLQTIPVFLQVMWLYANFQQWRSKCRQERKVLEQTAKPRSHQAKPPLWPFQPPKRLCKSNKQDEKKEETGDMPHYTNTYPQNSDIAPSLVIRTISEASHLVFHPTVFLICATNSTSGAAVHVSQLAPHGSATSIAGMPFDLPLQGVWADWV